MAFAYGVRANATTSNMLRASQVLLFLQVLLDERPREVAGEAFRIAVGIAKLIGTNRWSCRLSPTGRSACDVDAESASGGRPGRCPTASAGAASRTCRR